MFLKTLGFGGKSLNIILIVIVWICRDFRLNLSLQKFKKIAS